MRIVREVAYEVARPWRVADLWERAKEAHETTECASASSVKLAAITEDVRTVGSRLEPLPPGQKIPTPEQIDTALEVFSVNQWEDLIEGFSVDEADAVSRYMDKTGRG